MNDASFTPPSRWIDTNVYLSRWLTRRLPNDRPAALVARLKRYGVTSAWAGSFDALLHTDISAVNARVADVCARRGEGILEPVGSINPVLPDWEEDLRRCHEVHRMRVIRLHPNYHGYTLEDGRFTRLAELATRRGLLIQIALLMEDPRAQIPLLRVPPVQAPPLVDLMRKMPQARVMVLNGFGYALGSNRLVLHRLASAGVLFDIANVEQLASIDQQLGIVPNLRFAFGSYSPFYDFESARLKLQESALTPGQIAAIKSGNALAALLK